MNDLMIISDLDEIPNPKNKIIILNQKKDMQFLNKNIFIIN